MTATIDRHTAPQAAARADWSGRPVAVVGAGRTGASTARFLTAAGARVSVTDSRMAPPALEEMPRADALAGLALGGLDREMLEAAELVVVSPGVPLSEPAIRDAAAAGAEVVGDVELLGRYVAAPVVAVTGSNGKSTVTTLIGEMLAAAGRRVAVGGNLGTPVLDLLADAEAEAFVVEVSSFQAEALREFRPQVAAVLNLSADHLDRYADEAAYFDAKWRLLANMGEGDTAVLGADDVEIRRRAEGLQPGPAVAWFGLGPPARGGAGVMQDDVEAWLALGTDRGPEPVLAVAEWPLVGLPNRANAVAALAAGAALGLPSSAMADALRQFRGLAHRMEAVAELGGVRYVNDSKGTNVGAVQAALEGLDAPFVWIAGGVDKGGDFTALAPALRRSGRQVVLLGEAAGAIAAAVAEVVPVVFARTMHEAVARAAEAAQAGDAVVLSPGCTSFDQYPGFGARGADFRRAVAALEDARAEP
ncbi:UDP-N-acetylmuramoyl-L-alanine--D-glutamate ligase [Thiohalorhabdus sp.]|uniref:UDP-N-acetylmuramoyl-L-alanine--D-glutamate ligase n=1 Tax=Thiohalorhabdus sp. TaxID=3094134 RepID=UPI002FC337EF